MNVDIIRYDPQIDFNDVYSLFVDESTNYLIFDKPDHKDKISFQRWLESSIIHEFNDFVVFKNDNKFIGFAYSYNFNPYDLICNVTMAISDIYRGTGIGVYAFLNFASYLFKLYPLRKLYMHVYGYNAASINNLTKAGVKKEGVLKNHHYYDGKYHDLLIFSMTKQYFNNKILNKIKI